MYKKFYGMFVTFSSQILVAHSTTNLHYAQMKTATGLIRVAVFIREKNLHPYFNVPRPKAL